MLKIMKLQKLYIKFQHYQTMKLIILKEIYRWKYHQNPLKTGFKKSPGTDGFTSEFFKCFGNNSDTLLYGHSVTASRKVNYWQHKKVGSIVCIPKWDKPKKYIKNGRLIQMSSTKSVHCVLLTD